MMTALKNVIAYHEHLWTQPGWFILYVLSVVMIIVLGRKRWPDRVLVAFVLISGVISYFPLTVYVLVPDMIPTINEYARMGWLLLPIPVVAYAVARIVEYARHSQCGEGDKDQEASRRADNRAIALIIVLLVIVIIVINGNLTSHDSFYKVAENGYKLPQEVIAVTDVIENDAVKRGLLSEVNDKQVEVAVQGYTNDFKYDNYNDYAKMYYGIRQYTPRCVLTSFVMSEDDIALNPSGFIAAIPNYCDYAVIMDGKQARMAMQDSDYKLISDSGEFLVYARR